jgi:hypothetical protein
MAPFVGAMFIVVGRGFEQAISRILYPRSLTTARVAIISLGLPSQRVFLAVKAAAS